MIVDVRRASSIVRRLSSTIASKDIFSLTTGGVLTKLGRNDPYTTLLKNNSNGLGPLYI